MQSKLLGLAASFGLAVAGLVPAPARALEKVTLAIPTVVGSEYSEFVYGGQLGFFRDEGIELQLVGFQGSGVAIPQVVNKAAQFGLAHSATVITAAAKGDPLPVRFVYNWLRATTSDFAVLADGPVRSLADLKGRKLGVGSLTFASIPMTRAALKALGIDLGKDVVVRPVGVGAAAWKQLETGQVDALNLYFSEDMKMAASGLKIRQIPYPENFRGVFGSAMLAHLDTIKNNPKLVEGMGRAMAKSNVACTANRDACVRSFWTFDPTSKPTPDKEAEWVRNAVAVLEGNYVSTGYFPAGRKEWGSFAPGVLDAYVAALRDAELIPTADISRDVLFTNQFVPAFNDFDSASVAQRAQGGAAGK